MRVAWDIEASGLLNEDTIDYTQSPYKLRDDFTIHCIVCRDLDTGEVHNFVQDEVKTKFPEFAEKVTQWVSWNGINYDHLVLKLYLGLGYTVEPDTFNGKPAVIDDGMVLSKTLNPDRPGHSLEWFGNMLGFPKIDWRAEAIKLGLIKKTDPKGAEFKKYHPKMLTYCQQDTLVTEKAYKHLLEEWGDWDWEEAYNLEKAVAEIITRQEHFGFWFDTELAERNVRELDKLMEGIKQRVEPSLPPKPATKKVQGEYTPCKVQFKKSGEPSSNLLKFIDKIGGKIKGDIETGFKMVWKGENYSLPLPQEPLVTTEPMTLADSTHIKEYLVRDFGWQPTSWKERDLTLDSRKKKVNNKKFGEVVDRYVEQTLNSSFCKFRCEHLGVSRQGLEEKLLKHDLTKPLKVITNPDLTVGQDKDLCPGLEKIAEKYPHAQDIAHWLTYRHRRNSILGGGATLDDEAEKGFLSFVREDGRIPTPADTCGASSRRFLHRVVANIPRVSSLYGGKMRAMFGADKGDNYLIGADFTSLEAMMEAHYTHKYPGGKEYGESLTREKPNSVHCVNSRKMGVSRDEAKTVKYLLGYGGQIPKLAKSTGWPMSRAKNVYNDFWEAAKPLKLLIENLTKYWEKVGNKEFVLGLDGSQIKTRSKHSLLNNLLQSAGAICAKKQMVIFDRKLKENGLAVDFFKDDWKNKTFAQQCIAYHDENQVELSRTLVEFKRFETEEEAKEYKSNSSKACGEVVESKGAYYVPYSIVGQFLQEAAREASKELDLNVTLGMDYAVHVHWGGTH